MGGFFVTGTGTEVGKTLVTAALSYQLREQGREATVLKPVMSGYQPHDAGESDAGILLTSSGRPVTPAAVRELSPWCFEAPLSPDMAAAREGRKIDFAELVAFCRRALDSSPDVALIEGIGGAMVPLDADHTVLDWIAALDLPVLLVAGSYLGTLSHSLTTLAALAARSLRVQALVLSESAESPVSLGETAAVLARHAPGLRIAELPRVSGSEPWRAAPDLTSLLDG